MEYPPEGHGQAANLAAPTRSRHSLPGLSAQTTSIRVNSGRPAWPRWVLAGLVLALAHFGDVWAHDFFRWTDEPRLHRRDWYSLGRVMGYLPTWLALAAALLLVDEARVRANPTALAARATGLTPRRELRIGAARLALGAAMGGAIAELLKLVVGRERPDAPLSGYVFRPFLNGFVDGSNLGMPSSHAAVAFGAACALRRAFPGCGWVVIPLATWCAVGRMQAGDHYLSDVVAGAMVGWLGAKVSERLTR